MIGKRGLALDCAARAPAVPSMSPPAATVLAARNSRRVAEPELNGFIVGLPCHATAGTSMQDESPNVVQVHDVAGRESGRPCSARDRYMDLWAPSAAAGPSDLKPSHFRSNFFVAFVAFCEDRPHGCEIQRYERGGPPIHRR